jgi:hypothetical protein
VPFGLLAARPKRRPGVAMRLRSSGPARCSLCAIAVAVAGVLVASCAGSAVFPHQLPDSNGFSTDVTWQQAFRDHHVKISSQFHGLRYRAYSQVDGYPVWAVFRTPCATIPDFIGQNELVRVADSALLPSGSVESFAQQMGWQPNYNSRGVEWYQRPSGPSTNLEVLVRGITRACSVYFVASK